MSGLASDLRHRTASAAPITRRASCSRVSAVINAVRTEGIEDDSAATPETTDGPGHSVRATSKPAISLQFEPNRTSTPCTRTQYADDTASRQKSRQNFAVAKMRSLTIMQFAKRWGVHVRPQEFSAAIAKWPRTVKLRKNAGKAVISRAEGTTKGDVNNGVTDDEHYGEKARPSPGDEIEETGLHRDTNGAERVRA